MTQFTKFEGMDNNKLLYSLIVKNIIVRCIQMFVTA